MFLNAFSTVKFSTLITKKFDPKSTWPYKWAKILVRNLLSFSFKISFSETLKWTLVETLLQNVFEQNPKTVAWKFLIVYSYHSVQNIQCMHFIPLLKLYICF